ncbi:MAG: hypothetical protein IPN86_15320 [Saprospiraceae bacterium]|nr:hypothetical protein [Saprospiraceae bacterium]
MVSNNIKIGVIDKSFCNDEAEKIKLMLIELGNEVQIVNLSNNEDPSTIISSALINQNVSVIVYPLSKVPINKTDEIVIAGLSERTLPGECVIIHKDVLDLNADLKLQPASKILVSDLYQKQQLSKLRPDLNIIMGIDNMEEWLIKLENKLIDGIVISQLRANILSSILTEYEIVRLHPLEMIPQPGSGVFAYLVHAENMAIRKACQTIHQKATADVTNVERKVQQLSGPTATQAYCYKDKVGYYHLIVGRSNDHYQTVRLSQSTSAGLADKIIQSFHS